ncbi:MAG: NAD(P)H-binding protein [Myxococcales bacterium]|nr:NAD(P)H-binding protein [Myxococcales bacterium]
MRVFVAGATGYTGREVVRQLCEAGHEVIAHIRPDSKRKSHWESHFSALGASISLAAWTAESMGKQMADHPPEVVFALLGTTAARKRQASDGQAETYDAIDFGLTIVLLEAAEACSSTPRFVYLSSMGVRKGGPGAYLLARWKVEQRLESSRLPWTVARPSFITGDNRDDNRTGERVGATIADAALGGLAAMGLHTLRNKYASMRNDELAEGLIRHAFQAESAGQIIEATGLRRVTHS